MTLVTLALGIGGATAIFSVVHAVLLRPLPYHDESRVVMVWETEPAAGVDKMVGTPGNFPDWRAQTRTIDHLGALVEFEATLTGRGEPRRVDGRRVGASVFTALGVTALLGRTLMPEDETATAMSCCFHTALAGSVRRRSADHRAADHAQRSAAYGRGSDGSVLSLAAGTGRFPDPPGVHRVERRLRGSHRLLAIGRLKPGVSLAEAQADMDVIARYLAENFPVNAREGLLVEPIREEMSGGLQRPLTVVMAAVLVVMVIASINVANLLLARAWGRQQEMAVRLRWVRAARRLVRQLLTEAAFCHLPAAWAACCWLGAPSRCYPRCRNAASQAGDHRGQRAYPRVCVGLALITGLLFGTAPVLCSRTDRSTMLNDASRGSTAGGSARQSRARRGGNRAGRRAARGGRAVDPKLRAIDEVDPGFGSGSSLTFKIELPRSRYADPARWAPVLDDLMARLEALPAVTSAGAISWLPLTTTGGSNAVFVEGHPLPGPGEETYVVYRLVTPNYFRTLWIPLRAGRDSHGPTASIARVVVINETMAKKYWPGASPLGKPRVVRA